MEHGSWLSKALTPSQPNSNSAENREPVVGRGKKAPEHVLAQRLGFIVFFFLHFFMCPTAICARFCASSRYLETAPRNRKGTSHVATALLLHSIDRAQDRRIYPFSVRCTPGVFKIRFKTVVERTPRDVARNSISSRISFSATPVRFKYPSATFETSNHSHDVWLSKAHSSVQSPRLVKDHSPTPTDAARAPTRPRPTRDRTCRLFIFVRNSRYRVGPTVSDDLERESLRRAPLTQETVERDRRAGFKERKNCRSTSVNSTENSFSCEKGKNV